MVYLFKYHVNIGVYFRAPILLMPILWVNILNLHGNAEITSFQQQYVFANRVSNKDVDSAIVLFDALIEKVRMAGDSNMLVQALFKTATLNAKSTRYGMALEKGFECLSIAQNMNDTIYWLQCNQMLGKIYEVFNRDDAAIKYFQLARSLVLQYSRSDEISSRTVIANLLSLSKQARLHENTALAQHYIDSCYAFSDTMDLKGSVGTGIDMEYALVLKNLGKPETAIEYLNNLEQTVLDLAKEKDNVNLKSTLIFIYSHLGDLFAETGRLQDALSYYGRSLKVLHEIQLHLAHENYLRTQMASTYAQLGNFNEAYNNLIIAKAIQHGYFSVGNGVNKELFDIKNSYKEALEAKNNAFLEQELQFAREERNNLRFRIILIVIVLSTLLASLFAYLRFQKYKGLQKQKEADMLIELKNKDLTTHALRLVKMEELISRSAEFIREHVNNKDAASILRDLKKDSGSNWEEFNARFNSVYVGFYERLQNRYNDLSKNDLKICALTRLNFSSKEMAALLGISPGSVDIARHRLRKKMELDSSVNLNAFISNI